jgi:hypothetical protein
MAPIIHGTHRPRHRRRHITIAVLAAAAALAAVRLILSQSKPCIPYHTSVLTGVAWVHELLNGHPQRIVTELSVKQHVFLALFDELQCEGLGDTKHITLEEQLAIFLYTCTTRLSIRHVGERFQRSNESISL